MSLLTVEGTYSNGRVELDEKPLGIEKSKVLVTFVDMPSDETLQAARRRAFERMAQGVHFGRGFSRSDVYEDRLNDLDARRG